MKYLISEESNANFERFFECNLPRKTNMKKSKIMKCEPEPKIIDFVPLDDEDYYQ